MRLSVATPTQMLLETEATRIVAEAVNGSFGVLERHIDFVAQLRPGVLVYETPEGAERYLGLDAGTFIKQGPEVAIATHNAIAGDDLASLNERIKAEFLALGEEDRRARLALARLEAGMIRRFIDLENPGASRVF